MKATLTIVKGEHEGTTLEISGPGVYTLGRSRKSSLRVSDTSVSRIHCAIEFDGQFFWLTDSQSSNGTYVNRRKVNKYMMYDGDVMVIGRTHVQFRASNESPVVRTTGEPAAAETPPEEAAS